ncbi:uncharacterized protein B0J16DRAFT_405450 [Fusarium flagelliforme]|uniref:uncharacterized protein n=1 Tax=Fusarium flagelliforme TaxID=2675880 RepID=UPI001E8ED5AB|nr:uncharacterized protein B0J16DRAFT_405450 [Fusarium flagelliforme]KAH7173160.1 hypothetical protein B0J16DRAFT_405450 [Fusarium flagelliforme]
MANHKLTPALMASSLVLGLLLALSHHLYYLYLNGRIVQSQSQQQWSLRAGTALAFLIRALLSAAIGIAYVQLLWQTVRTRSITIRGVNSLFGVIRNAWDFVTLELWTAAPSLVVVAIISCRRALPLVAVITPATLTAQVSSQPNITILNTPIGILDYSNLENFGRSVNLNGNGDPIPSSGSQLLANASNEEKALNALWWTMDSSVVSRLNYLDQLIGMKGAVTFYVAVPGKSPFQAEKPIVCQLYNSAYALNYTFSNDQQHVHYETKKINTVGYMNGKRCDIQDLSLCSASHAYLSLMDAMGHFVRGTLFRSDLGGIDPKETQIKSSVLMETKELQALNEDTSYSSIGNISMADALEELFLNFTISLFSNQKFVQNKTAATPGPITYSSTQNEFAYEPRNLIIAYGVGFLLTLVIVIFGLLCIRPASASYGSSFSTILRTTRNPDLDTVVPTAETTGAEPLSKHLGNIRLLLRREGEGLEKSDDEKVTFFAVESKSSDTRRDQINTPAESLLRQDEARDTDTSIEGSNVNNR